jgi:hypothetical protein
MTDWLLVLTLLSVAAVLACFRFIGCAQILGIEPWTPRPTPADYGKTITAEPSLVAWWRLGETTASPGVTAAKDEQGAHDGTYRSEVLMAGTQSAVAAGFSCRVRPGSWPAPRPRRR